MAVKNKVRPEFSSPVPLKEDWLEKHKDHMLVWVRHTIFDGKQGVEYKECRCYTCTKVAREVICEVSTAPEKKSGKTKRRERSSGITGAVFPRPAKNRQDSIAS
jgi:hypothetical protein